MKRNLISTIFLVSTATVLLLQSNKIGDIQGKIQQPVIQRDLLQVSEFDQINQRFHNECVSKSINSKIQLPEFHIQKLNEIYETAKEKEEQITNNQDEDLQTFENISSENSNIPDDNNGNGNDENTNYSEHENESSITTTTASIPSEPSTDGTDEGKVVNIQKYYNMV